MWDWVATQAPRKCAGLRWKYSWWPNGSTTLPFGCQARKHFFPLTYMGKVWSVNCWIIFFKLNKLPSMNTCIALIKNISSSSCKHLLITLFCELFPSALWTLHAFIFTHGCTIRTDPYRLTASPQSCNNGYIAHVCCNSSFVKYYTTWAVWLNLVP